MQQLDFYGLESKDAVRMSWNNLPSTKVQLTRAVVPIGVFYCKYFFCNINSTHERSRESCSC